MIRATHLLFFVLPLALLLSACSDSEDQGSSANRIPTADAKSVTTDEDTPIVIRLTGSDPEDEDLTFSTGTPSHGTLINTSAGATYTYTPAPDFNGSDSFTFTVSDGELESEEAVVTITVNAIDKFINFQSADVVIGQPGFGSVEANQNGSADANTLRDPYGNPAMINGALYLPDFGNNRLLGFDTVPAEDGAAADFVLGQNGFTDTDEAASQSRFYGPQSVAFGGGRMFLTEYGNHRVLIWNSIPSGMNIAADLVLGQSDFSANGEGGCSATGLSYPESLSAAAGKLLVADANHNRILIWNTIPATNNTPADLVLGQQDFSHCAANDTNNDGVTNGASAATLDRPTGVWSDGTRLVVTDTGNNRILIWNSFPTSNFTPADVVLGQNGFNRTAANDDDQDGSGGNTPSARTLKSPYIGVHSEGKRLYVTDSGNNRVLIWNEFPASNFAPADVVLGQKEFTLNASNDSSGDGTPDTPGAETLYYPTGIHYSDYHLIVADYGNNRYLIYTEQ